MNKTIRIGTRGSQLALWQAEHIASLIKPSGYLTEIVPLETKGDKVLDVTLSKIGSKGVFTEEIEAKLLTGEIDIAVHSAKDMPTEISDDLELVAFTEREEVNDVVVSYDTGFSLSKPGARLGTASTRRVAFLHHFYPDAKAVPIRGNLQTRMAKLKNGECDALILAFAGVHRMGFTDRIVEKIGTSYFVPAVGQGSIVVECRKKLDYKKKEAIVQWVNHPETERCILTERSFLHTLKGGCSIPAFGYAHAEGNLITLKGGIISLDGKEIVKVKETAPADQIKELGVKVAEEVLAQGGAEILRKIKSTL